MDLSDFRRLFVYDRWANHEVLIALRAAVATPSRSVRYMAHIVAAERLWLERLEQRPQTLPVWPDFTVEQCDSQITELASLWENFLEGKAAADLLNRISYTNSKGENWTSRVDDVLLHVIMHSGYHRGQIASDMRAAGLTPAYIDFIHAVRQGSLE
jgi:uncharacterized damage-inducible protein DinB